MLQWFRGYKLYFPFLRTFNFLTSFFDIFRLIFVFFVQRETSHFREYVFEKITVLLLLGDLFCD